MKANLTKRLVLMLLSCIMSICSWAQVPETPTLSEWSGATTLPITTATTVPAATQDQSQNWTPTKMYYTYTPTDYVYLNITKDEGLYLYVYTNSDGTLMEKTFESDSNTATTPSSTELKYMLLKGVTYYLCIKNTFNTTKSFTATTTKVPELTIPTTSATLTSRTYYTISNTSTTDPKIVKFACSSCEVIIPSSSPSIAPTYISNGIAVVPANSVALIQVMPMVSGASTTPSGTFSAECPTIYAYTDIKTVDSTHKIFSYTATETSSVSINQIGGFSVYNADGTNVVTAGNSFNVTSGNTYYIDFSSYGGESCEFSITSGGAGGGSTPSSTQGASRDNPISAIIGSNNIPTTVTTATVWYTYTPATSGSLSVTYNNSSKPSFYEGTSTDAMTSTDTQESANYTYKVTVDAGKTYYISIPHAVTTFTLAFDNGSTPSAAGESYSNPIIITSGVQQTLTASTYYKITNSETSEQLLKITTTGDVYTTLYDASYSMMTQPIGSTSCSVAAGKSVIIYATVTSGSSTTATMTATLSTVQPGDTKGTAIDLSTTASNTVSGEKWFKYTCSSDDVNKYLVLSSDDNLPDVSYQTSSSPYDCLMSSMGNVRYVNMSSTGDYYIHFKNVTSEFTFNAAISSTKPVQGSQAYPMDVTSSGWLDGSDTEVWFKYTATSTGTLTITPTDDTSSSITGIELYTSNASGATAIAKATGTPLTLAKSNVTTGSIYYIKVTKNVSTDSESVSISLTEPGTSRDNPLIATIGTNTVPAGLTSFQHLWLSYTPTKGGYVKVVSEDENVLFFEGNQQIEPSNAYSIVIDDQSLKTEATRIIDVIPGTKYYFFFSSAITSFTLKEGESGTEADPFDIEEYSATPSRPGTYWYRTESDYNEGVLMASAKPSSNTVTIYSSTDHVNALSTSGVCAFTKPDGVSMTFDIKVVQTTTATGEGLNAYVMGVSAVTADVSYSIGNSWYKYQATKSGTMTITPECGFGANQEYGTFDCYVDNTKIGSTPVYNATNTTVVDAIKFSVDAGKFYYFQVNPTAANLMSSSFTISNEGVDAVTVTNNVGTPTTTDGVETSAATAAVTALATNTATSSFVDTGAAEAIDTTSTTSAGTLSDIIKTAAGTKLTDEQKAALTSENIKTKMSLSMKSATVGKDGEKACVKKVAFDVKPTAVVVMDGVTADINATVPNELITKPITFRLPVDANYSEAFVKVYHKGDAQSASEDNLGLYEVKTEGEGDNISKYIELSQQSFSEYGYESNNFDPTNINFAEVYLGKSTKETGDVSLSQWSTKLQSYPNAVGIVASSDNISDWAMNQKNVIIRSGSEGSYTYTCPNFVLTDIQDLTEGQTADFYTPCDFTATAGSYSRKPNAVATSTVLFNSVCLPFELQSTDLSTTAKILTYDSHTESTVTLKDVSGNLAAGTPCIIYDEATAWNTISLAGKTIVGTPTTINDKMKGTFVNTTSYGKSGGQATTDYYSVNVENKFQTLASNLSPFRSCIYLGTEGSGAKSIVVIDGVDNETTGVENIISTENKATNDIYNLNGCKVGNDINSLPRGIYIIGGKKVLIK